MATAVKKIRAQYIGKTGQYIKDQYYEILIEGSFGSYILVTDLKGENLIQYLHVVHFLNNWTLIHSKL